MCFRTWQFLQKVKSLSYGEILPEPNPNRNALGELYTIYLLSTSFLACSQFCLSPMNSAPIPRDFRKRTWSNICETSGEITRTIIFAHFSLTMSERTEKSSDFPDPLTWKGRQFAKKQSIFHFDKATTALFFFDGDMTVMTWQILTRPAWLFWSSIVCIYGRSVVQILTKPNHQSTLFTPRGPL